MPALKMKQLYGRTPVYALMTSAMLMAGAVQAQGVVDMHAHIITPSFLADLRAHDALLDEGFPIPQYDVERHLQWMDEARVLTVGLERMRKYLGEEPDLAPFREMILHKNAEQLLGLSESQPLALRPQTSDLLVRLAEIEVYPEYLSEYLAAGSAIAATSVREEPGVLCLFPMQSKEDSTQVRILEIYASQEAYERHIATAHFLKYKQGTMHMVKSLKLSDMRPLDPETMNLLFKKIL